MRGLVLSLLAALAVAWAPASAAQSARSGVERPDRTYKARLSPVPIDVSMQATIAGSGAVTATVNGKRLQISGTFEGLKSPATVAALHKSPVRGVRGPELAPLTVAGPRSEGKPETSGTVSGSVELTPTLETDLAAGRLYVQIHSEKAPDGNLWGWLLSEAKR